MFEVIRNGQHNNRFVYYGTPGVSTASWYTFTKPPGINFISFLLVGGGGGGGAGRSGSTNQATRGGGGGGGGAAITTATFLAATLPDTFYISPGCGGAGGVPTANAGGAGVAGNASIISVWPNQSNIGLIIAHANGGNPGNGAVALAAGGAATAAAASATTNMPLIDSAIMYNTFGGSPSTSGGTTGTGADFTPLSSTTLTITGGAGGAGCSTTAGALGRAIANTQYTGNVNPSPLGTTNPSDGRIYSLKPFISIGGAGGSSNATASGSPGGDGAYGAGGGGGAGGLNGTRGGNGGPGLVIVTCY